MPGQRPPSHIEEFWKWVLPVPFLPLQSMPHRLSQAPPDQLYGFVLSKLTLAPTLTKNADSSIAKKFLDRKQNDEFVADLVL